MVQLGGAWRMISPTDGDPEAQGGKSLALGHSGWGSNRLAAPLALSGRRAGQTPFCREVVWLVGGWRVLSRSGCVEREGLSTRGPGMGQ